MKKIYQAPKMEVIHLMQRTRLLEGSVMTLDVYGDEEIFTDMQI